MPERPRANYSPAGIAELRRYWADLDARVAAGAITMKERHVLATFAMQEIEITGHVGDALRRPRCNFCGQTTHVLGKDTQRFRCPCRPEIEQSVLDGVRRKPPG